jgi:serine/threonine protein kinase
MDRPVANLGAIEAEDIPLFSAGKLVLQRFTIIRLVGSGAMGDVYEAKDNQLGRVALKTIRPELASDPHMLFAFVEMAESNADKAIAALNGMNEDGDGA